MRPARCGGHGRRFAGLHSDLRIGARHRAGPTHDLRHRVLSVAGRAVLHPGRQPDEHRRHHQPDLRFRHRPGGLDERGPRAGQHHRLGHLLGHVGHRHRRRRGPGLHRNQGHEGARLPHRIRRGRHRGFGHAGPHHSAFAALRHLRHDGQRVHRGALSGRHPAGPVPHVSDDADRVLLRTAQWLGR